MASSIPVRLCDDDLKRLAELVTEAVTEALMPRLMEAMRKGDPPEGPLLTKAQTAELFGVGKKTIERWVRDHKIPEPIRINGFPRWRRSDLISA